MLKIYRAKVSYLIQPPGANLEYLRHSSDGRKQENIQYDANKSIYMESYVSTSQTMSVLSFEPDTMRRPSGENATERI